MVIRNVPRSRANKPKRTQRNQIKKRPEFTSNYKILTINIPEPVLDSIDSLLGKLYASRSEAIRRYCMRCVGEDLKLLNQMDGNFVAEDPTFFNEDGADYFRDNHNKIWYVGETINV